MVRTRSKDVQHDVTDECETGKLITERLARQDWLFTNLLRQTPRTHSGEAERERACGREDDMTSRRIGAVTGRRRSSMIRNAGLQRCSRCENFQSVQDQELGHDK